MSVDGMECPKCGHAQATAVACRKCGLVIERWQGPSESANRGEATALWFAVEAAWADERKHDAFLAWAQRAGELGLAAAKYRAAQKSRADAEPMATRALQRIERLAVTALTLQGVKRERPSAMPYRGSFAILALVLFLVVGGLVWASMKSSARQEQKRQSEEAEPMVPRPTVRVKK